MPGRAGWRGGGARGVAQGGGGRGPGVLAWRGPAGGPLHCSRGRGAALLRLRNFPTTIVSVRTARRGGARGTQGRVRDGRQAVDVVSSRTRASVLSGPAERRAGRSASEGPRVHGAGGKGLRGRAALVITLDKHPHSAPRPPGVAMGRAAPSDSHFGARPSWGPPPRRPKVEYLFVRGHGVPLPPRGPRQRPHGV